MKKTILITFLLLSTLCYSQSPSLYFHTRFGSSEDDVGHDIIQNSKRGYYALGETNGYGVSQKDILLAKTDTLGVPIWQKTYGGISSEIGKEIIELSDSSLVFVGYTNSFGNGGYDAYIVRIDKYGTLLWQQTFGGLDWDFAYSIDKTTDGNLIICGSTFSYGRGAKDGFILKMDYSGNLLWNKFYGGTNDDELKKIIQTNDGGYIAVGTTMSYGDPLGDIWVTKFNSMGDSTWFKTQGGIKMEVGNSVVQDNNYDYLITGGSESFSAGKEDAYIFKMNNAGNFVWHQYYGMASEDEESFDVLNSGSSYGCMLITYGTKEQSGNGFDIKTLLLDCQGYYVRGGSFGGPKDDIGYSLFNTKDKGYIACGYTESFNALKQDFFIVKYDSEMTIGPLIVSIEGIRSDKKEFVIYPTIISEHILNINGYGRTPTNPLDIKIYDVYGRLVENIKIEDLGSDKFRIVLPQDLKGLIFIRLNEGEFVKKCIVQ